MPSFLHTSYRIGELDRSLAFYEKLGFKEIGRKSDDATIHVFLALPGEESRLELIYDPEISSYDLGDGYSHIAIRVKDLEATVARLASQGVTPESPPFDASRTTRVCVFRDPDGYLVALFGPPREPASPTETSATTGDTPSPPAGGDDDYEAEQTVAIDSSENVVLPSEDTGGEETLRALWNNERFARIVNTGTKPLLLRLPYAPDNRDWLRSANHREPKWNKKAKRWELPLSWHEDLIRKAVDRYGEVIVIMHTESRVMKCAPACWRAKSSVTKCHCSCGGALHGVGGNPGGFHEVNEALALKLEGGEHAVVHLVSRSGSQRVSRLRVSWKSGSP